MDETIDELLDEWALAGHWRRVAYISAPLRTPGAMYGQFTPHGLEANTDRAKRLAEIAWQAGWATICPHLNTLHMDGLPGLPSEAFIEGDSTFLRRMRPGEDAGILGIGWEDSEGSQAEREVMVERKLLLVLEQTFRSSAEAILMYMRLLYVKPDAAEELIPGILARCGERNPT